MNVRYVHFVDNSIYGLAEGFPLELLIGLRGLVVLVLVLGLLSHHLLELERRNVNSS